jgi:hypothetical protein
MPRNRQQRGRLHAAVNDDSSRHRNSSIGLPRPTIARYIRSHNLQNPENRREILADDKLQKVFGKDKVTMFEMNKHLTGHLK